MTIERTTVHISHDTGRIAMLEKRTYGTDDSEKELVRYIYSNHLQSSALELDAVGDIISYEEYHPYGTTAYQAMNALIKATAKRYRYTGKERDEESGLYYHGARYYIPWLCRWSASDPLENKYAGMSPYNYGNCNPITFNDPSGAKPSESLKSKPPPPPPPPKPKAPEQLEKQHEKSKKNSSSTNADLIGQPQTASSEALGLLLLPKLIGFISVALSEIIVPILVVVVIAILII